jgi:hypothetical protein
MRDNGSAMERIMKLSSKQEKERLAQWLRHGVVYDPRNEEDYDTFEYGTEPLPNDYTWAQAKGKTGRETSAVCFETTPLSPQDLADE